MQLFVCLFAVLCACIMFSWQELFAAHPLTTDDAGIVEINKHELEIGYDDCKKEDELRNCSAGLSLKHGVTGRFDIGVSFPYQVQPEAQEQLGTATVGLKFLLVKDLLALTVNNELGAGAYFLNGIVSHGISLVALHLNIGYLATGDAGVKGDVIHSFAVEWPMSMLDLVGEVTGTEASYKNYLVGFRYKIEDVMALNLAYGNGFSEVEQKIVLGFHSEF